MRTNYDRLLESLFENNYDRFSLTKLGMLIFLFPSITFVFIYDVIVNNRMDWMNTSVFICGIVTPRLISQLVVNKLGGSTATRDTQSINRRSSRLNRQVTQSTENAQNTDPIMPDEVPFSASIDINDLPDLSHKNK